MKMWTQAQSILVTIIDNIVEIKKNFGEFLKCFENNLSFSLVLNGLMDKFRVFIK